MAFNISSPRLDKLTLTENWLGSVYGPGQFMNPGPAPRPPTDRPRLNLMPSTANVPGNMSTSSLQSPSVRSTATYTGTELLAPSLSRSTTLTDGYGGGGVAVIKEGYAKVKDGLLWKNRYLVLRAFQLDFHKGHDGKVSSSIQLKDVTGVSRSESTPLSFEITRVANANTSPPGQSMASRDLPQKTTICQLKSDDDIYDWIDVIYNRCPGMGGVSNPTNFSHRIHVGFDPVNGSFVGLPLEWERLLTASAITKEDYQKHPQAVIEVLEFYSDITKRSANPDVYPSLTPTPPVTQTVNKQLGHGGGGTAIAPPRPAPPNGMGSQPGFAQQGPRLMQDGPSRSHNGTPVAGQRNFSGSERPQDPSQSKMGMDQDMRRIMEEEARKVKAAKEQRERDRAREEEEQTRREHAAYNTELPKSRTLLAKQELGGYGGSADGDSSSSRYNPSRNAPPAPGTDRSRHQPHGSLRQVPAQRSPPATSSGTNGSVQPPRAPFSQAQPPSRDQSPTEQASLRTPSKPDQQLRQPSPSSRPAVNDNQRNQSPQTRVRAPPATSSSHPPPSRLPAPVPVQPTSSPTAMAIRQPTGAPPATNGSSSTAANQAKVALTAKAPARQKEVRMSSMTESQVMEKLKQVVSKDDPQLSYSKQKKIGQGASGSVYVARINENAVSPVARRLYQQHGVKANVAIKQMDLRNQPRKELIVNEIIVMKESSHPNIVNFLDSFLQEGNNELWVVMEYMEGGALTDVIDNNSHITEAQISTICNEVNHYTPVPQE